MDTTQLLLWKLIAGIFLGGCVNWFMVPFFINFIDDLLIFFPGIPSPLTRLTTWNHSVVISAPRGSRTVLCSRSMSWMSTSNPDRSSVTSAALASTTPVTWECTWDVSTRQRRNCHRKWTWTCWRQSPNLFCAWAQVWPVPQGVCRPSRAQETRHECAHQIPTFQVWPLRLRLQRPQQPENAREECPQGREGAAVKKKLGLLEVKCLLVLFGNHAL